MKIDRNHLLSALNLHLLAVVLLAVLDLVLCLRLAVAWNTLHAAGPEQLAQDQTTYRTLDLQTAPLRGLPHKVDVSREDAAQFYDRRFPSAYSQISSVLGQLAAKDNVRLSRVSYTQSPAIPGIAEVRMDANLSGEYAPLMHFINSLERDKNFFVINGLTLTGQQGGLVNLRLRLSTYLHSADLDRLTPPDNGAAPPPPTPPAEEEVNP